MAVAAAYASTVAVTGTSTGTTGEATSAIGGSGANVIRQITSATKQVMDPTVAVVVKDGGTPVAATSYKLNYMFGKITFISYTASGAITVDYNYLPLLNVIGIKAFSGVKYSREAIKTTAFSRGTALAGQDYKEGIRRISGTLDLMDSPHTDYGVGAVDTFWLMLKNAQNRLVSVQMGASGPLLRAFVLFPKNDLDVAPGNIIGSKVSFVGAQTVNALIPAGSAALVALSSE